MSWDSVITAITHWLPPYTEQWATTYLQVLFESFLFALGVPTAIYSLIVDDDIKRVAQTRVKARRYFIVTALLYVAVFMIVWFLHPEPHTSNAPRQETASIGQERSSPPPDPSTLAAGPMQSPVENPTESAQSAPVLPILKSLFAAFTVTFLPFAVLITGLRLNGQFRRERVIQQLADELLHSLDTKSSIDTVALRDLSYLGEHGRPGNEKEIVLNVIDQLADKVQDKIRTHNLNYSGYELESLIRHIPAMLDNAKHGGNDENFLRAVDVLANIWRWLGARKVTSDAVSTREALTQLGLRSVVATSEETSLAYLEIAAECDCHMVFEMGIAAVRAKKYRLVTGALTKLESMATSALANNEGPDVIRETNANLLGITAELAAIGPSGNRRAETTLRLNGELFKPTLAEALKDAFDYQYVAGRFDIADKIRELELRRTRISPLDAILEV